MIPKSFLAQVLAVVAAMIIPLVPVHAQAPAPAPAAAADALDAAIAGTQRSAANEARDVYRHPKETMSFFGFKPDMTVVEIWPDSGWFAEILTPGAPSFLPQMQHPPIAARRCWCGD